MEEFKDRLRYAMGKAELKQADIVERTGINKGALSSYLRGSYKPKQDNTYKLAKVLNVNEAWLMGLDVKMTKTTMPKSDLSATSKLCDRTTKEEAELIKKYHRLNADGKEQLNIYINGLLANEKYIALQKQTIA